MTQLRIPLERLRLPRPIPAGMNLVRIAAIADTLLQGGEIGEPALVRLEGPGQWSVTDGRHRLVAAYVAGVPDLWCVEEARWAATDPAAADVNGSRDGGKWTAGPDGLSPQPSAASASSSPQPNAGN